MYKGGVKPPLIYRKETINLYEKIKLFCVKCEL